MSKSAPLLPLQSSLFPPPPPQAGRAKSVSRSELWAALHFPRLALEVLRDDVDECCWVVVHEQRGQPMVYEVSAAAQAMGVVSGMALTAAYALCPELETEVRDETAEQACLRQLADWAGQYSSLVSLEPQALLLEIGASLKLFGGLAAMQTSLEQGLQQQIHVSDLAIAPTPQAALLLARCAVSETVTEPDALRAVLGRLPLSMLPVTEKQNHLFTKLGLSCLRDLWRLPDEGLAKRFGLEFIDYLDRLLGYKAEPRVTHQAAPSFSASWSFLIETDNMTFILHGIEQLLPKLIQFMRLRTLALNRLQIIFYHPEKTASRIELGMQQLCRDAAHIFDLLQERLNQEKLIAPVLDMELFADEFHHFVAEEHSLFADAGSQTGEWQQMLDQLQTRLGVEAVNGLQLLDEHRPEYAWVYGLANDAEVMEQRPLWLLPEPKLIYANRLKNIELLSEPERIEGGWWDGVDIQRDYYRGRDIGGQVLWLFCDLKDKQWYWHGVFG